MIQRIHPHRHLSYWIS